MHARANNILLLSAVFATLAAVWLYRYIPPKRFQIIPSLQWKIELAAGNKPNENRAEYWIDQKQVHVGCKMDLTPGIANICVIDIILGDHFSHGVDLSSYDTLVIDADYSGNAPKVRVFQRNFNPLYSNVNDGNSGKFMALDILTREFNSSQPVRIKLKEFSVSEWWLTQRELERKYLPIEFNNVTILGFDFGQYLHNVPELSLHIKELYFEGTRIREQYWYLGILCFWVVGVVILLAVRFIELIRRNNSYTQQISDLALDKAHFEKQSKKYKELSLLDPLTNILNRLGLEKECDRFRLKGPQQPAALIILDIDHFKRINDRRGHDVGDAILKSISRLVQEKIRQEDVFARWGGEEFVLIIPNANITAAYHTAEKIRSAISENEFELNQPWQVTGSFGVTLLRPDESFGEAFKRADQALYQAKNQGRNCVVLDPALHPVC